MANDRRVREVSASPAWLTVRVDSDFKQRFKALCVYKGVTIQDVLHDAIKRWYQKADNFSQSASKDR